MFRQPQSAGNKFQTAWARLEGSQPQPQFIRAVRIQPYNDFAAAVMEGEPGFVEEITSSLYAGDAYVLRNAYGQITLRDLTQRLHEFSHSLCDAIIDSGVIKRATYFH